MSYAPIRSMLSALLLAPLLVACGGAQVEQTEANPLPHDMKEGPGLLSGKSGNLLDAFKVGGGLADDATGGTGIGVNPYLWRAALETVSFMPVTSADSSGGTIITDWYTNPKKPDERVKMNVFILGRDLSPQNIRVAVFKQIRKGGNWQDVPVAEETANQLEETILTDARTLRVKSRASR